MYAAPSVSATGTTTDQLVPLRTADSVWSTEAPLRISTVTVALSPAPFAAVPVIVGVRDVAHVVGAVTTGAAGAVVSTVKVTALLVPECPAASVWVTVTVQRPSLSVEAATDQAPPETAVVFVWLTVPPVPLPL